ncbi:MAG: tetratricopeptide repeat protein [Bacteroidetes bacterium]|nr:tetratricopeptide repeat protein [Bacteroidota bacterium]
MFLLILFIFFFLRSSGNPNGTEDVFNRQTDSLEKLIPVILVDTQKFELLDKLSRLFKQRDPSKALHYATLSMEVAQKTGFKNYIATSYLRIGVLLHNKGEFNKALSYHRKAALLYKDYWPLPGFANSIHNIGLVYDYMGNYNQAIRFYLLALKLKEASDHHDKNDLALTMNNLGLVFFYVNSFDKALEYHNKTLQIRIEKGDSNGMGSAHCNIGIVYGARGDYDNALEHFTKALSCLEKKGDRKFLANILANISKVYTAKKDFSNSIDFITRAFYLYKSMDDPYGMAGALNTLGGLYVRSGNLDLADSSYSDALIMGQKIGAKEKIKDSYEGLTEIFKLKKNYFRAYEMICRLSEIKDTILNEQMSKQITEMQTKYETEKKKKEIALQKAEIGKKEAVINQQNIQRMALGAGILLMVILATVIYKAYHSKKKTNVIITAQKQEVESQKKLIEEKNNNITESIEYAGYIQKAVLPEDEEFRSFFPDSFILYRPRDIVSGDFYWIAQPPQPPEGGIYYSQTPSVKGHLGFASQNPPSGGRGAVLLAVCDCTGHGVPGAFMSMLCTALLNETVNDKGITEPDKILENVRSGIIAALKQKGRRGEAKDGMDAVLIKMARPNSEGGLPVLEIAAANNPCYIVSNGVLSEYKPDRFPVGVYEGEMSPFTLQKTTLNPGDMLYAISDGLEDQLGGSPPLSPQRGEMKTPFYGKKFKSSRLKELLQSISSRQVAEQKQILEKTLEEWKGAGEQTDDISVIGIRI